MKKVYVMLLALVAMFAFSAFLAGQASAATTLLAEWLVDGAAIPTGTTDATTSHRRATTADGVVGANGQDETKEILNSLGE